MVKTPVYMDYHSTTPVDPRVLESMLPYFEDTFGNAASIDHLYGHEAQKSVEHARATIARCIGARDPEEIIFTSGATESNNLAIQGVLTANAGKGNHFVTCATEHRSVLDVAEHAKSMGIAVTVLPVDKFGLVDIETLEQAITDRTIMISIMVANNEIGTIQPVEEIGRLARKHEVLFHTDATQAVGHIPIDVEQMNVDLMSFSAHKLCGPKGIGGLYVRRRRPWVRLAPIMYGGGHERGFRSGTLNVPAIVGFATAVEIARKEMVQEASRLRKWTEQMLREFEAKVQGVELNGDPTQRLAHNLNIFIPGVDAKVLIMLLRDVVAFSTGSACTSARVEPSHVIAALGFDEGRSYSSVRFGLGRWTTEEEVQYVTSAVVETVKSIWSRFGGRPTVSRY